MCAIATHELEELMNMQCGWSSSAICHHCHVTQQDYVSVPSTLHTAPRRSFQNFVTECACPNCALHSRAYLKLAWAGYIFSIGSTST